MKSYDDLQRFKEKTQTNNIKFKDMSEQTLESDTTNWAIIKQLLNDNNSSSALDRGQSIDVIQPQPVAKDQFSTDKSPHQVVKSFVAAPSVGSQGGTLFDSIAATLKPAAVAAEPQPEVAAPQTQAPAATAFPALGALGSDLSSMAAPEPAPQVAAQPAAVPLIQQAGAAFTAAVSAAPAASAPAQAENALRYKQLFNARHTGPAVSVTKESLLKPLLEKIALCR
ncbi:cellulose biosynthesis protein BcsO [Erwiniaceae bacterium BAC15a-03b]|uniref:Cellulose biosynthesis protein BcsO n=1 Tax=Winslowiella arboricola TaxID=2978220 RepID=A0A9J6PQ57_9GAMM|nr:cellulose biosynthesis protein BcsO [Winslowiella arboricola]MCU5773842.1 cellulose biosynthesis protein BcsO [Winslowiella arboricola]MCU5777752.1 cellulose biosynthesis protein BcsO [Winslowiella arboricola]